MKQNVTCKCPRCQKIFKKSLSVFDYNPDKLFYKYCDTCREYEQTIYYGETPFSGNRRKKLQIKESSE